MRVIGALELLRIVVAVCVPAPQLSAVQFDVQRLGCLGQRKRSEKTCHFKKWTYDGSHIMEGHMKDAISRHRCSVLP